MNRRRALIGCLSGLLLSLLACCGGVAVYFFGTNSPDNAALTGPCTVAASAPTGQLPDLSPLTPDQTKNAATIVTVGQKLSVPPRGWVIAVATAMQESDLTNLGNLGARNDHDSLGLFQQRPSQGWGTPAQILDPTYASTKFYQKLRTVNGWEQMPLTVAAQAVQRSAFPDAYAKWEPDATQLVGALVANSAAVAATAASQMCALDGADLQLDAGPVNLPAGFSLPAATPPQIVTAIGWALKQIGTPYSFGGSCTDSHSGQPALQCDCSSLTQQSYRAAGVTIPRIAAAQANTGTPIYDPAQLLPGDLIFLVGSDGTRNAPGHVGMYLGQGIIIQAPHTGTVVKLTTLGAWQDAIVAIRRIVPSVTGTTP